MPAEIVKYERIQTTDEPAGDPTTTTTTSLRLQDGDEDDVTFGGPLSSTSVANLEEQRIHDEHDEASRHTNSDRHRLNVAQRTAATVTLILCYFCLSIGLTFYQRWLLRDFPFPLFVVLCHLVIKLMISLLIRCVYRLVTGRSRALVDWRTFCQKVSPTGLTSGIDIGFSNWGLELVTISLYTMTKSTTIIFILIFAILLGLERRSWSLMTIVVMISVGLCLFTYKSTEFNGLGFSFLLFASLASGMRWSFAQLIMHKSKLGLDHPVDMVFHMQPWMIVSVLPFAVCFEGRKLLDCWSSVVNGVGVDAAVSGAVVAFDVYELAVKIIGGACVAYLMELSEFLVLSFTSSLTLAVSGIFKEICQLVLAVELNGDRLSALNVVGLVMCLGGICSHVLHKYRTMLLGGGVGGVSARMVDVTGGGGAAGGQTVHYRGSADGQDGDKRMMNGGGGGGSAGSQLSSSASAANAVPLMSWKSSHGGQQSVPLLMAGGVDDSDEEEDDVAGGTVAAGGGGRGRQNSSDIIFDVLKRRDIRRQPM